MTGSKTFLILDDVEINRTLLRSMLSMTHKYSIIVEAASGTECVTMYDELLSSFYKVDCVFIDYMLPDMLGTDVIKQLRSVGYEGPSIVITASDQPTIKKLEDTKLFCKVIQKPLNMQKMKQIIDVQLNCHQKNCNECPKLKEKY